MLLGQLAQLGDEARRQRHLAPRGAGGLEHDGGDVLPRLQRAGDMADIVGRQQDGLVDQAGRNARGHAALEVRHGARRHAVVPAVEVADEADHLGSAGERARQPQRQVRGLGAGAGEAHHLGARHQAIDQLRPPHLQLVRGAPVRAERHLPLNGLDDGGMPVAQQQRAMAAEIVDVLVAVDVPLARARRAGGIDRIGQQRAAVVRQAGRQHLAAPARKARPSAACAPGTRPRSWSWSASLTLQSVSLRHRAR